MSKRTRRPSTLGALASKAFNEAAQSAVVRARIAGAKPVGLEPILKRKSTFGGVVITEASGKHIARAMANLDKPKGRAAPRSSELLFRDKPKKKKKKTSSIHVTEAE